MENKIYMQNIYEHKCLRIVFKDHFTEPQAKEYIQTINNKIKEALPDKLCMIWDCSTMSGYDSAARVAWQQFMKENKEYLGDIWIISKNKILTTIAKAMALLTNYKLHTASDDADLMAKMANMIVAVK
ncbi:MAG: hypothetical protein NZ529_05700 [Cytophagaceae bacterium]|nr:hypothetical protein [Cytophagaceae bacterium]MDW8456271.1 hypothetical protein [Cytophagaceae bacterium]